MLLIQQLELMFVNAPQHLLCQCRTLFRSVDAAGFYKLINRKWIQSSLSHRIGEKERTDASLNYYIANIMCSATYNASM